MSLLKITVLSLALAIAIVCGLHFAQQGHSGLYSVQEGDKLCVYYPDGTRQGCWGRTYYP